MYIYIYINIYNVYIYICQAYDQHLWSNGSQNMTSSDTGSIFSPRRMLSYFPKHGSILTISGSLAPPIPHRFFAHRSSKRN